MRHATKATHVLPESQVLFSSQPRLAANHWVATRHGRGRGLTGESSRGAGRMHQGILQLEPQEFLPKGL